MMRSVFQSCCVVRGSMPRHCSDAMMILFNRWFMDGNFSIAPHLFEQLYVIRAPVGTSYVTCAYGLLSGKSQAEYEEFIRAIVNQCRQLGYNPDPNVIMTDFEISVIRATKDVIGSHVEHRGCFYHLTQSTWRKVILTVILLGS